MLASRSINRHLSTGDLRQVLKIASSPALKIIDVNLLSGHRLQTFSMSPTEAQRGRFSQPILNLFTSPNQYQRSAYHNQSMVYEHLIQTMVNTGSKAKRQSALLAFNILKLKENGIDCTQHTSRRFGLWKISTQKFKTLLQNLDTLSSDDYAKMSAYRFYKAMNNNFTLTIAEEEKFAQLIFDFEQSHHNVHLAIDDPAPESGSHKRVEDLVVAKKAAYNRRMEAERQRRIEQQKQARIQAAFNNLSALCNRPHHAFEENISTNIALARYWQPVLNYSEIYSQMSPNMQRDVLRMVERLRLTLMQRYEINDHRCSQIRRRIDGMMLDHLPLTIRTSLTNRMADNRGIDDLVESSLQSLYHLNLVGGGSNTSRSPLRFSQPSSRGQDGRPPRPPRPAGPQLPLNVNPQGPYQQPLSSRYSILRAQLGDQRVPQRPSGFQPPITGQQGAPQRRRAPQPPIMSQGAPQRRQAPQPPVQGANQSLSHRQRINLEGNDEDTYL